MNNIIVYIGGFNLPNRNASAVRVIENAWLLKELGYRVILIGKLEEKEGKIVSFCKYETFECYDIRKPFKNKQYKSYIKSIEPIEAVVNSLGKKNIHAIVAYNYPAIGLNKVANFSQKNNIIAIADITEWYGWEGYRLDRNIKRFIDTEYRMRIIAKKIGNIICAGSYLENFFMGFNTVSWPFCVNTDLKRWELSDAISVNSPRTFVYSGSPGIGMSKDKINLIFKILYELKLEGIDFKYIVLGITKEQYLNYFKKDFLLLKKMDKNIEFRGRVSHAESLRTLKNADFSLFIRPNNRVSNAGFSTKVMEAFTSGIPTITNATSDIPKYINHKINGFIFNSIKSEDIKSTLLKSLNLSDKELLVMKSKCRKENPFALKNFKNNIEIFLDKASKKG